MPIQQRIEAGPMDIGESEEERSEWAIIKSMVQRGKSKNIKPIGKKILKVTEKLPKNNPKVFEIEVNGSRYAIVKIVSLG